MTEPLQVCTAWPRVRKKYEKTDIKSSINLEQNIRECSNCFPGFCLIWHRMTQLHVIWLKASHSVLLPIAVLLYVMLWTMKRLNILKVIIQHLQYIAT